MPNALATTFQDTVEEGVNRVRRTWPALLATGTVGGIDVSVGVLGTFLVLHNSGNEIAAALAFGIGFVALTLANSELFTENFLVPIAAMAARKASLRDVLRLWAGTFVMNVVGGVVMVVLIMLAFPELADTAVEKGAHYIDRGFTLQAFASAVLAGIVITLMTWMQHGTRHLGPKLVAAVAAAFLLSYGHLSHVVVASLEVIAGIMAGASYGVSDWLSKVFMWAFGNAVGGIGLVTVLRLIQVGARRLQLEQNRPVEDDEEQEAAELNGSRLEVVETVR
ncbi:MAG: formate/nitrite transporter family protein [Nitriliruptorales bacterium]|nr:formate/nitrite transporter family protein [Nitriliruptorales bacterium]